MWSVVRTSVCISEATVTAALFLSRWPNKSRRPTFFKMDDKSRKPGALIVVVAFVLGIFVVDAVVNVAEIGRLVVVAAKVTGKLIVDADVVETVAASADVTGDCCLDDGVNNIVVVETKETVVACEEGTDELDGTEVLGSTIVEVSGNNDVGTFEVVTDVVDNSGSVVVLEAADIKSTVE